MNLAFDHPWALWLALAAVLPLWKLQLTVEGERSEQTLLQQLGKLHDCLAVEIAPLAE